MLIPLTPQEGVKRYQSLGIRPPQEGHVYSQQRARSALRQEGHVKLAGYSIQEHMALLAEGGPRSLLVYKHDPPAEGEYGSLGVFGQSLRRDGFSQAVGWFYDRRLRYGTAFYDVIALLLAS